MKKKKIYTKSVISLFLVSMLILLLTACETDSPDERDYFKELGVKSFINAGLPYSTLGGSQMWPEVIEAINYASLRRARMEDLHNAVGEMIASMIGCESAMVSAGAASALTLGTAACMTGTDKKLIRQLPDSTGMKNEVIIQKAHRYVYEHAVRCSGAKIVEVETAEDLEKAINEKTAMLLFYYGREPEGMISAKEYVAFGKKNNIPVCIDGATTVPPAYNLSKIMDLGCELATFSGGKGLQGPYSAGLLLGRKDLIEAARLNSSPHDSTIGRGMKVSKEEILGMMVAVEVSLKKDYESDIQKGKEWMQQIAEFISDIPSITTEIFVPEDSDHMPRLCLKWDDSIIKLTPAELKKRLRRGEPSIEVVSFGQSKGLFQISSWMLKSHELETVGKRIKEELQKAI